MYLEAKKSKNTKKKININIRVIIIIIINVICMSNVKINETEARALMYCQNAKRPRELWMYWKNEKSYAYICSVLSGLEMLKLMTKRNIRHRGKNATFYTTTDEGLLLAKKKLQSDGEDNA